MLLLFDSLLFSLKDVSTVFLLLTVYPLAVKDDAISVLSLTLTRHLVIFPLSVVEILSNIVGLPLPDKLSFSVLHVAQPLAFVGVPAGPLPLALASHGAVRPLTVIHVQEHVLRLSVPHVLTITVLHVMLPFAIVESSVGPLPRAQARLLALDPHPNVKALRMVTWLRCPIVFSITMAQAIANFAVVNVAVQVFRLLDHPFSSWLNPSN